jgi:hypothetical protein
MRRSWRVAITSIVAVALAVLPMTTAAAAGAVLAVGSTSGPAVAAGDSLSGTGNATFANSANPSQNVMCTMSVGAEDVTDPVPSGQATLIVGGLALSNCTFNGFTGANGINSITFNGSSSCPWNATVDDTTSPATVTVSPATASGCPTSISFDLNFQAIFGAVNCVYSPTNGNIVGTAPLGGDSVTFSNVPFTRTSGPGTTCFPMGSFSATFHFTDTTQGGGSVFVN